MLLLAAFALVLSVPPVFLGFPTSTSASGHDVILAVRWINAFATQFWQGDLYPRWLVTPNNGFGEPTFYFYPPLPYYLAALLGGLYCVVLAWRQSGWVALAGLAGTIGIAVGGVYVLPAMAL
jgi:uncharacterized membrane protein